MCLSNMEDTSVSWEERAESLLQKIYANPDMAKVPEIRSRIALLLEQVPS